MCGLFGFVGTGGRPDIERLERIALATEARGRDAFGFAWVDGAGRLKRYKTPGPASERLGHLALAYDARALIGHCRLATHGPARDNENNHPHPCDGGWLAHNGVVANWRRLVDGYMLEPTSQCDTEAIARLVEECAGTLLERGREACSLARGDLAVLGLWHRPVRILVARRGKPLAVLERPEGRYLASEPHALLGGPKCPSPTAMVRAGVRWVDDWTVRLWTLGTAGAGVRQRVAILGDERGEARTNESTLYPVAGEPGAPADS